MNIKKFIRNNRFVVTIFALSLLDMTTGMCFQPTHHNKKDVPMNFLHNLSDKIKPDSLKLQ